MQGFPVAGAGQRIGLLGGSFDPAHEGHVEITRTALARFGLDQVWWLVTPANPIKVPAPSPLSQRLAAARARMQHPKVKVTDIERRLGTTVTAQTLARLKALYPQVNFVWLMGADNLVQLPKWGQWRQIMEQVPVGIMARPGVQLAARGSKVARIYAGARLADTDSQLLGGGVPPAWCFVNMPLRPESSSQIRGRKDGARP